jgi:hypothetical protein
MWIRLTIKWVEYIGDINAESRININPSCSIQKQQAHGLLFRYKFMLDAIF